ncbi:hypothetical protein BK126_10435 [Paenibacillus sp. FSL H7-0326]|nr:hypothetical protein BK126_10435 [Paenibacillus sp. FSL H7-0326]
MELAKLGVGLFFIEQLSMMNSYIYYGSDDGKTEKYTSQVMFNPVEHELHVISSFPVIFDCCLLLFRIRAWINPSH